MKAPFLVQTSKALLLRDLRLLRHNRSDASTDTYADAEGGQE